MRLPALSEFVVPRRKRCSTVMLCLMAGLVAKATVSAQAQLNTTLACRIDSTIEHPVPPLLGGVSLITTFKSNAMGPDVVERAEELRPTLLRFPAGMHSMHFDWKSGRYLFTNKRKAAKQQRGIGLDSFFVIAQQIGAEVIYVVNVNDDSPAKTFQLAQHIKQKQYPVRYWEMGNEAAAPSLKAKFPDVEAYLQVARSHAEQIRRVFADAVFGLTAQNDNWRRCDWNKALAKQDWCRNIVVHRYCGPEKRKRERLKSQGRRIPHDRALASMLANSSPFPPGYVSVFPGKYIWLTEWSTLFLESDVENTMADALWVARTFLKFLRTPEITLACYFDFNSNAFGLVNSVSGNAIRSLPYYVFEIILPLLKSSDHSVPILVGMNGRDLNGVSAQVFTNQSRITGILFVNASGREQTVGVGDFLSGPMTAQVLGTNSASASNGYALAQTQELRKPERERIVPVAVPLEDSILTLPPFCVIRLHPALVTEAADPQDDDAPAQ